MWVAAAAGDVLHECLGRPLVRAEEVHVGLRAKVHYGGQATPMNCRNTAPPPSPRHAYALRRVTSPRMTAVNPLRDGGLRLRPKGGMTVAAPGQSSAKARSPSPDDRLWLPSVLVAIWQSPDQPQTCPEARRSRRSGTRSRQTHLGKATRPSCTSVGGNRVLRERPRSSLD